MTKSKSGESWAPHGPKHLIFAAVGLIALYAPTYWTLANGLWQQNEYAHGPLILAIIVWLMWRQKDLLPNSFQKADLLGMICFTMGLAFYFIGRSLKFIQIETASQVLVIGGSAILIYGLRILYAIWFPLFYLLFTIPMPGFLIDLLTEPLKEWASACVVDLLYFTGYPAARNGVVILIGQYQLLVADACSGLHSILSLSALGLLIAYLYRGKGRRSVLMVLISIIPIAFLANLLRILTLVLVTYYFGDSAGRGFVHESSGLAMMSIGLLALIFTQNLSATRGPKD